MPISARAGRQEECGPNVSRSPTRSAAMKGAAHRADGRRLTMTTQGEDGGTPSPIPTLQPQQGAGP